MRRSGFGVMALGVAAAFFMAGRAGYFLHAGKHFLHAGKSGTAAVSAGFAVIDILVATVIGVVLLSDSSEADPAEDPPADATGPDPEADAPAA